jgi:hypothetical protein
MKKIAFFIFASIIAVSIYSQELTTNRNSVGMEHNMLFNAQDRYTVTQTGSATLSINYLFNGKFLPAYTATAPTVSNPTIIEIAGLPKAHIQAGAWIGWSTRYWPAKRFKIEGYDEYYGNGWTTLADYENVDYSGSDFYVKCKAGAYTKLRYTFYEATGTDGRLGVSELYFLHPEATSPYNGLFGSASSAWDANGSNISYSDGAVSIGTTTIPSGYILAVNGKIIATEVKVETGWADFVFEPDYNLMPLKELEIFIQANKHLPEIPTTAEVKENGISVGEMNAKLLQKIEELTLYLIQKDEEIQELKKEIENIKNNI